MAGLLACESSAGRLPNLTVSDMLPFVIAYSGGSAEDSSQWKYTPLPYQALSGTTAPVNIKF